MPSAAGLVRDTQPFCDARFTCREVKRFEGIVRLGENSGNGSKSAHQVNDFRRCPMEHISMRIDELRIQRLWGVGTVPEP